MVYTHASYIEARVGLSILEALGKLSIGGPLPTDFNMLKTKKKEVINTSNS